MQEPRIPYTKPSITDLEVRYATDAAANGWGDPCCAFMECFEALPRRCAMAFHGNKTLTTGKNEPYENGEWRALGSPRAMLTIQTEQ